MLFTGRKTVWCKHANCFGIMLEGCRGREEHQKCSPWMRRAACQRQWYITFRSIPTMFKTSKLWVSLALAALCKRDEPGTAVLGSAIPSLGGGSMADGQHIPAMNPIGKGLCMHVGHPRSLSAP